jgi:hypothetical protein
MARSYAEHVDLPCPGCAETFAGEIWLIVDVQERGDLAERALNGTLHDFVCPHCEAQGQVEAPLLYHDGQAQRLVYAAPQQTSSEQDREIATQLAMQLLSEIDPEERGGYLSQVDIVPSLEEIGAVLTEDRPEPQTEQDRMFAAFHALLRSQSQEEFDEALSEHPIALTEEADAVLGQLITEARDTHDAAMLGTLSYIRGMIDQARTRNEPAPED